MVTNTTMLEYMLIRRKDAPVIEKVRGMLKVYRLDEADIGSRAAELALLLRRVMQANVGPVQINLCKSLLPRPLLVKILLKVIKNLLNLLPISRGHRT